MANMEKLKRVDDFLLQMIEEEQIPGAVYGVITENETIAENALGYAHKQQKIPMSLDTIFDLASLTKVSATLPSLFLLIEEGYIDLDDPIQRFFPNALYNSLTIKHLLTHTSGLVPHVPFYKLGWTKEQILDFILTSEPHPGEKVTYSDLNFILLGFLVEKISGETLDRFAKRRIFGPLAMPNTSFNPEIDGARIAPTEFAPDTGDYIWGQVHDENAAHLNGVSGHAGLFSDLNDMKKFVRMLLRNGKADSDEPFLSASLLKQSRQNYTETLNLNRGLGWQLVDNEFSPLGYFLSKNSYGHTGFTGTSFWIDPERQLGVILLANRVHISRAINMNRVRRVFHNLIAFATS